MTEPGDVETRLREHLARVDAIPPTPGLEARIIDATEPRSAPWRMMFPMVAVMVVVVTLLVLLTIGHQSSNVFTNISSGLGS